MAGYEITKLRAENAALRNHISLLASTIKTLNRLNLEHRKVVAELTRIATVSIHQRNRAIKGGLDDQ